MKLLTKMQLMMYIGNDFIESVDLDTAKISKPGYLGRFKRNLKLKHKDLITKSKQRPDFLVVPSTTKSKTKLVGHE